MSIYSDSVPKHAQFSANRFEEIMQDPKHFQKMLTLCQTLPKRPGTLYEIFCDMLDPGVGCPKMAKACCYACFCSEKCYDASTNTDFCSAVPECVGKSPPTDCP